MKLLRSTTAFCCQLKTFCSSLPLDIRIQTNDCLVMRPRSASRRGGGAIQLPQLQLQSNGRQEERMKLGLWLGFVHYVVFSALILMIGWQQGHRDCRTHSLLMSSGFVPEQVNEEDPRGNLLTQVEEWFLHGSSTTSSFKLFYCAVIFFLVHQIGGGMETV